MLSLPFPAKTEWLSMLPQGDRMESNTYNNKNDIVIRKSYTIIFLHVMFRKQQIGVHQRFSTGGSRPKNGLWTARKKTQC